MRGRWASIVAQLRKCHGFPATDTPADPDKNRSIPACAGEPRLGRRPRPHKRVYPRVCGGTGGRSPVVACRMGLSPRVRENRGLVWCGRCRLGSIPACAGEPGHQVAGIRSDEVYPRVCGGTAHWHTQKYTLLGLSPRVRGNPRRCRLCTPAIRSIPACAGEPRGRCVAGLRLPVYPRVCGGTSGWARIRTTRRGLSPRVRGNPGLDTAAVDARRSIPACAGEPARGAPTRPENGVYPRVCGGTVVIFNQAFDRRGLSPRVRGNHPTKNEERQALRSIPACAGEPSSSSLTKVARGVYPRVCGGTRGDTEVAHVPRGLSPRVRGNRVERFNFRRRRRSIPACAGEPTSPALFFSYTKVYPRVCGGTSGTAAASARTWGLSPRVRGNRWVTTLSTKRLWSIPACAGEPTESGRTSHFSRVYPRVCGGTSGTAAASARTWGLSPRVRGNPIDQAERERERGSIPACAGEPVLLYRR